MKGGDWKSTKLVPLDDQLHCWWRNNSLIIKQVKKKEVKQKYQ